MMTIIIIVCAVVLGLLLLVFGLHHIMQYEPVEQAVGTMLALNNDIDVDTVFTEVLKCLSIERQVTYDVVTRSDTELVLHGFNHPHMLSMFVKLDQIYDRPYLNVRLNDFDMVQNMCFALDNPGLARLINHIRMFGTGSRYNVRGPEFQTNLENATAELCRCWYNIDVVYQAPCQVDYDLLEIDINDASIDKVQIVSYQDSYTIQSVSGNRVIKRFEGNGYDKPLKLDEFMRHIEESVEA